MVEGISGPKRPYVKEFRVNALAGERAGLRLIKPHDKIDTERMFQIEKSPGMIGRITEEEYISPNKAKLISWIRDMNKDKSVQFYGVTADKSVDSMNHGEVEGWIRIDGQDSKQGSEELERYQRTTHSTLPQDSPLPYEITCIKRPGSPSDLMVSAITEAVYMIAYQDAKEPARYKPPNGNIIEPRRVVMAFIDPNNEVSKAVFTKAGFVLEKESVYWDKDDQQEGTKGPDKDLYILDWDRFHKNMEVKKQLLLDRLQRSFQAVPGEIQAKPHIITTKARSEIKNALSSKPL